MKKLAFIVLILCLCGCSVNSSTDFTAEPSPQPSQDVNEIMTDTNSIADRSSNEQQAIDMPSQGQTISSPKPSEKPQIEKGKPVQSETAAQQEIKPEAQPTGQPESKRTVQLIISADREILNTALTPIEGETVIELLKRVTKEKGIPMKSRGFGGFSYVESIDNLKEFDKGPTSGWTYYVNGEFQQVGAGQTKVKVGDIIEWKYTK